MNIFKAALRKPSQQTQMEATMVGLSTLLITGLITSIYVCFFTNVSLFIKIMTGAGEIALFLVLGSNLAMVYQQYEFYKVSLKMSEAINKQETPLGVG